MYYKSINRGLAFTKPGLYFFGLVLLIGMLAVVTGVNAFYLILCSSLGIFVVSGILSEQALKACRVRCSTKGILNADAQFEINLLVENKSNISFYGLEQIIMTEYPRYRLLSRPIQTFLAKSIIDLPAKSCKSLTVVGSGLKRGVYDHLIILQQTQAPFGILEKYRFNLESLNLVVAPCLDKDFLGSLEKSKDLDSRVKTGGLDFFGHKPSTSFDKKNLDWKKNVQKPTSQWVVKVFKEEVQAETLEIIAPWAIAEACCLEADYEQYLSAIRTMIYYLEKHYRNIIVNFGNGKRTDDPIKQLELLAKIPTFKNRQKGAYWFHGWEPSKSQSAQLVEFDSPRTFKWIKGLS
jgi:hypothetical protein